MQWMKKELATIVMKHLILFSYNKDSGHCELANIDFLEDPSDNNPKTFYIDVDEVPTLNMNCRGGKESTLVYQEKVNIIGICCLHKFKNYFGVICQTLFRFLSVKVIRKFF